MLCMARHNGEGGSSWCWLARRLEVNPRGPQRLITEGSRIWRRDREGLLGGARKSQSGTDIVHAGQQYTGLYNYPLVQIRALFQRTVVK